MLRSFRVANHKSIRDEQELLLVPAYDKDRVAVPVAAIFGSNASGKSNLIDALVWMRDAVLSSHFIWDPAGGVPRRPFLLGPDRQEPSLFAVELVIDGVRHVYGFVVDDKHVREEWVYTYPKNRKRVIFERDPEGFSFGSTVPDAQVRAELLAEMTRPNALLVSVAARSRLPGAGAIVRWFQSSLVIADLRFGVASAVRLADMMEKQPEAARAVVSLLEAADVGVTGVDTEYEKLAVQDQQSLMDIEQRMSVLPPTGGGNDSQLAAVLDLKARELRLRLGYRRLALLHGDGRIPLPIEDESAGTHVWLSLMMSAVNVLEHGGLLVVDEIDASLHPRLTAQLVSMFHDPEVNQRGAQLICTTHDATLLGTLSGEDVLHRDEVWFVEKGQHDGETKLYPLTDFHPRKEESTQRRYLGGSYGAVPMVSTADFRRALGLDPWGSATSVTA